MSEQLLGGLDMRVQRYKDSELTKYTFSNGHSVHLKDEEVKELVEQATKPKPVVQYLRLDGRDYALPWVLDRLYEQYGIRMEAV